MLEKFESIQKEFQSHSFEEFLAPAMQQMEKLSPFESKSNRSIDFTFEDQLKTLIYYHLEEHVSGRHLLQALAEDDFAKEHVASDVKRSTFFEAINTRGLKQLMELFELLQSDARLKLPRRYSELGKLVAIDGSFIDAVLSMIWADYRKGSKKAKVHMGFDVNRGIPKKFFLAEGKSDEGPYVSQILDPGETGILDRYYQCYKNFDSWQDEDKHFVCRIKASAKKTVFLEYRVESDSHVFYDAVVLLGTPGVNQTQRPVRLVGYEIDHVHYWVATDRYDLTAEEIANIYKLRWTVESFFAWWKRHLNVYHILARSEYGLMVQIFAGLITYLLLAIHCREEHGESVSIKRVRELRFRIKNEATTLQKHDVHTKKQGAITKKFRKRKQFISTAKS
jgi:hypothetical protein